MAKTARPWLKDMLDDIAWIERMTDGKSFTEFAADRPLRDAVERNIERISEASRLLPEAMKPTSKSHGRSSRESATSSGMPIGV